MDIINKGINELIPYDKNPRKNDEAVKYVMKSIKEFGFKVPIVIDKNNVIVCGHTRYKASKKLKLDTVPCIIADDLTDEQIRAFRLADNKVGEKSEWDIDLLNLEFDNIVNFNMEDFGFEFDNLDESMRETKEDKIPKISDEPNSKLGEIYLLGDHRLMCGDSTNRNDVSKLMNGYKADLVVTDPPYNVDYTGGTDDELKIINDNMTDSDFKMFLKSAFQNIYDFLKEGSSFYIWYASREHMNFESALNSVGLQVRQCLIWNKNSMVLSRQDYHWKHEPCLYGWKDGAPHKWYSDRSQTTVLDFDKPKRNDIHPTMKPLELIDYQIQNSSKENDIVLDLFGGSGTTLIACEQNGRQSYTMELDTRYVDVIIKRWENLTGEKAILIE